MAMPASNMTFFFSSRRRHTRCYRDWSQTCALPIYFHGKRDVADSRKNRYEGLIVGVLQQYDFAFAATRVMRHRGGNRHNREEKRNEATAHRRKPSRSEERRVGKERK